MQQPWYSLRKEARLPKSQELLKTLSLHIQERAWRKNISVSVVRNNIASVYTRKKQYEQAISWHKKDLEICEEVQMEL